MLRRRLAPLTLVAPLILACSACSGPSASETDSGSTRADSSTGAPTGTGAETVANTDTETSAQTETETETGEEPACPAQTAAELMDCVDPDRYLEDLELVTGVRDPGSAHWQEVQDLCADRLTELGYEVELDAYGTGVNVLGTKLGTDAPSERVIVGGHYDHIPGCSGADDNGSGIAAALEIARVLAEIPTSRTLVVVCWDEEELGLIGSQAHAQAELDAGTQLQAVFDLDSMGYASSEPNSQVVPAGFDLLFPEQYAELEASSFRGDFLLWVSDDAMQPLGVELDGFAESIGLWTLGTTLDDVLKNAELLADLRRSDHASFWALDLPAMFFNDTGEFRYPSYHCAEGDDVVAQVNLDFAVKVTKVALATTGVALGL